MKLDAMKIVRATGNIPENINFAIKTGMIRDFLDNSVVPYETAEPKGELKTAEIAGNARGLHAVDHLHRERAGPGEEVEPG